MVTWCSFDGIVLLCEACVPYRMCSWFQFKRLTAETSPSLRENIFVSHIGCCCMGLSELPAVAFTSCRGQW